MTGIDPLEAFVCDEGLARFCTSKYEAPAKSNFKKAFMHLTNYSVNKESEDFVHAKEATVEAEDILKHNDGTKRTLTSLYATLNEKGIDTEMIKKNIKETCSRIM